MSFLISASHSSIKTISSAKKMLGSGHEGLNGNLDHYFQAEPLDHEETRQIEEDLGCILA